MKKYHILLLCISILLSSCRKNTDEITQSTVGPIRGNKVESAIFGRVTDINGSTIGAVDVFVGGLSLKTNSEGLFVVPKQLFDDSGTLVRVSKEGYFETARFAFPHLNGETFLEIRMIQKYDLLTFNAASGGTADFGYGAFVHIPANAVANADGTPYQGQVRVMGTWFDPTRAWTFNSMPGDLRGIDKDGKAKILKTFGMLQVELESTSGEKLNLLAGKTAKITFPLPASILPAAPALIPLWHFNMSNGYWEESGSATLLNGKYEAEVSHFSFWNCDAPVDFIKLNMCFGDAAGTPLNGLQVRLESQNFGTGSGFTDNHGLVSGLVPAAESLNLIVEDRCGNVVYQSNIGLFNADTDLGKVLISGLQAITVSGNLTDCANAPLQNGIAAMSLINDSTKIYTVTDASGAFSFNFYNCADQPTVKITGYNLEDLTESGPQTFAITGINTNVGNIFVCTPLESYIVFNCNGLSQKFIWGAGLTIQTDTSGAIVASGPGFSGGAPNDSTLIYFGYKELVAGHNAAELAYLYVTCIEDNLIQEYGCLYCQDPACGCKPTDAGPFVITNFPNNTGEFMSGSTSGLLLSQQDFTLKPFTLNFKARRTN